MADTFDVETKAIFIRSVSGGKTKYRRAPFNIVTRTNKSTKERKTYMELTLGGGHHPGRANGWEDKEGELYDAIEYLDTYPAEWPRIGICNG